MKIEILNPIEHDGKRFERGVVELADELAAMVSKKIYRRVVRYLEARAEALGGPAVPPGTGMTRNGADGAAGEGPPARVSVPAPVRLPHPAVRRTPSS